MTIDLHIVDAECRDLPREEGTDFGVSWSGWARWFEQPMRDVGAVCRPAGPSHDEYHALDATWGPVQPTELVSDDDYGAYQAAYRKHFRAYFQPHRGECPGIPAFKFASNDPWWVIPAEIRPALHVIGALSGPPGIWATETDTSRWDEWVEFLTRAADEGGFRVG